jgi:hypothetical protein
MIIVVNPICRFYDFTVIRFCDEMVNVAFAFRPRAGTIASMPYWKPLVVDGVVIDLSHLEPFEFQILPKGLTEPATVRAVFNNHCFSAEFDASRHRGPLPATHVSPYEVRGFDLVRYELSKLLPVQVRELDGKRIAQTRTGTLVRITLADGRDYGIFFTLTKMGAAACEMFVMSAYPLERPKKSVVATGEMKFNVAVALVLSGRKPKFPPGRF